MPILRLAYSTQFLIALIAIFVLWGQVGGQTHLDLMPWYLKLGLGAAAAFAIVKATMAAVGREPAWNGGTLKWVGILLAILAGCGLATYYYHVYGEQDEEDQQEAEPAISMSAAPTWSLAARICLAPQSASKPWPAA
jgi:hypothetical protein